VQRVAGVDVARGWAILGMFTAHLADDTLRLPNGSNWLEAADGRSAAMFALLAGVSAGFISRGGLWHARVRILVRAALLAPLGVLLAALGTRIAVILPSYALMFAMLTVALAWRPWRLLLTAGVVLLVAPPVVLAARDPLTAGRFGPLTYPAELLVGEYYPALVWIAYLLVGLALVRLDLTDQRTSRRLVLWGLPLAVAGYGAGAVAVRAIPPEDTLIRALLDASPHADSAVEVVGNIGVAMCVLAVCLVLGSRAVLYPVAATGALALTAYSVQVLVIAWLGDEVFARPRNLLLAAVIVVTLAAGMMWRKFVGRGPLEAGLHRSSTWVADRLVPSGRHPETQRDPVTTPGGSQP
jgi:uncharacterized membrane protein YeiB